MTKTHMIRKAHRTPASAVALGLSFAALRALPLRQATGAYLGPCERAGSRRVKLAAAASAESLPSWLSIVQVDLYADVACPWCYVGKRNLDLAAEEFGSDRVAVSCLPFIVDSGVHTQGEEYAAYTRRRWGGDGWTLPLRRMAAAAGGAFRNWRWWPASMPAHRLVRLARSRGISTSTTTALIFEALYEEGSNISEARALARLAASRLGLDEAEVLRHLESTDGIEELLAEIEEGRRRHGFSSVPHFVVRSSTCSQQYSLTGAHPPEQFLELFRKVCNEE
mmetsp:Transcript_62432/g.193723  ORF Transcript_62432/g.193723 Transcript_62432/m.193723 type:complete len:280 (+) Transcript_62432:49-888(+)